MTNTKHTTPQIPMKDFYTVQDVAILLGTGVNRIRELANRKSDPLPFRCFAGIARSMFINRIDLADWVKRNTTLVSERKATDADDGDHEAIADSEVTIVDEVAYKGLTPGEGYTVTGTLMDKETGKPVQSGGKDVTATASFVPDKSSGSVSLSFTFDGSALKGHDIVAFETVSKDGAEVAAHADIDDAGQTVSLADKPVTPSNPMPKGGLPETGDSAPWIPLACLAAAAACGIAILALMRRKGHWGAEGGEADSEQ